MSVVGRFSQGLFNGVFRRNYVFLSTVFVGAFAFEMAFDTGTDAIWNRLNKGRQWRDIKQRYMTSEEDEE
ncbi:Cytochrome b-c1 complex subunit 9 [Cyphellophora attinorum]|uniref:Complex III subunit 9 n=1 Tax=Cyphellophora attinorum TaxID=1664694 RepID=A0A0N1H448_9EURO|nr:Cytochrome b-c1 complex subunit 9 [Phialophora attinorum]KPI40006.1 Cytochrome b-c1 complex subunit 9 [Phialophora attinorum]